MLKAEQLALIQEANQQLLAIRQLELEYYTTVFSNFGTVAALVAGFTMSALTSLDAMSFQCAEFWRALFWLAAAVCLGSSLHCVLTTTFVNVFGTGLALRGPTGSMVRSVDGMMEEKEAIFNSFIACISSFLVMGVAIGWIIMSIYAAAIFTFISLIASYFWARYCNRIFLRFKIHNEHLAWQDKKQDLVDDAPSHDDLTNLRGGESSESDIVTIQSSSSKKSISFFGKKKNSADEISDIHSVTSGDISKNKSGTVVMSPFATTVNPSRIWMEGYLTKKGTAKGPISSDPWARRYFVLKGSNLYYYTSREVFESDPSKTIKNRPIDVTGYTVLKTSIEKMPYLLELSPEGDSEGKRIWQFKCDTSSELDEWAEAFKYATGSSTNM